MRLSGSAEVSSLKIKGKVDKKRVLAARKSAGMEELPSQTRACSREEAGDDVTTSS